MKNLEMYSYPVENRRQYWIAYGSMMDWLTHPNELGKEPAEFKFVKSFGYNGMVYYIFKFKEEPNEEWKVGVSGGFTKRGIETCGHTFSDFKVFNEETAEKECIKIIERLMYYWKDLAKRAEEDK